MPKRPGRKSAAQTPAPRSERIYGSKKNKPGSASRQSEAKISLSPQIKKALKKKADEFNEKHPTKRVRVTTLEKVFRRGAGAYSKSHRPTITGNVPNTRSAWSFARVNKFLKKKSGQKVKAAYVQDDDLLMDGGEVMAKGGLLGQYAFVDKNMGNLVGIPDKGMAKIVSVSKKLQSTKQNENANELEIKLFNLIADWIEDSDKKDADALYKNKKIFDIIKKQYPAIFRAPKNKLVYRGIELRPQADYIQKFFSDIDLSELIAIKGELPGNDFYFIKKPIKHIPRLNAESWTTELKTAMRFGEDGAVLVTKTSDAFYMTPDFMDAVGSEVLGKREHEVILIGKNVENVHMMISHLALENFLDNLSELSRKKIKGLEDYFAKGGEVRFNDKELLSKYKRGESIGFTAVAHLKAKGLIPRADGTKRKSEKYLEDGGVVFVRNKNYDNSHTIRRLPYRGVSAFAVATDDFEKFKQYAEKEEGVDPSNWQVYDMDDFDNYQVCAMKMSETNDYVMGWSDDKPKLEPFDAQEHTMYIDEDGNLDYDDAHEIIILPTKTMDRGGMTAIFVNNMLESAKDIDNIIEYALENDIKPTDPEFNTKVNPDGKYSAFEIRLAKRELKKYSHGGELPMQITCKKCGWSWNTADSQPQDATMCHKCGFDNVSEDIISMNAPTYLRSLEFAREDAKEDVDLHKVTENAVALSKEHPIRMKEYDELVKLEDGGVLPELTDEELAFMRKMMKSSPLLRKFMDSEEITIANRLVKKGWLEKGTSSDTPHSVIYLVELKPADIEKYGLDEYADGGQLFAYEPKEYDIQEFICKEQDLADVVSNRGDMTKLGKIRVCQAKINLAEDKLKNATSDREVEAWYMSTCIWTDCMNGLKSSYKSGGKVGGCGCYKDGGLAYGNSHDKGGMPLTVKSTGQNIEIEGGEGVVNKRSMQMNKTVEFQGKKLTPCEVVSKINEMGGGVKFKCDDVKKIIAEDGHFD